MGQNLLMPRRPSRPAEKPGACRMYFVPCSCGIGFAVSERYDRQSGAISRYLPCPNCGKRHDPRNRLLQLTYYLFGFWNAESC